jgi:hypothetical protein
MPTPAAAIRYYGSAAYYRENQEILRTYELAGRAPYASPAERAAAQPNWDRAASPEWKVTARPVIEAEQSSMFWSGDTSHEYEIWSVASYSSRAPWAHQLCRQIALDGAPCTTWAFVGHCHKRQVSKAGEALVLKGKIKTGVIMKASWKPDPGSWRAELVEIKRKLVIQRAKARIIILKRGEPHHEENISREVRGTISLTVFKRGSSGLHS